MEMAENYREKTSFLQEQWRDTRQRAQLEAERRNSARIQAKIIQRINRSRKTEGKRLPIEDQAEELKGDTPEPPPSAGASSSHEKPAPEAPGTADRKVIKGKTKKSKTTKEPKKDGGAQHFSISDNKLTMKQIAEKLRQKRSARRVAKGRVVPSKPKVVMGRVIDKSDWYDIYCLA